ncbi:flagellar biosynthesis regulator FlaF [Oleispirillum naphthae]|uniref:flagellar biosynthesis regulator FlaF n=1 Tax=Oleispirillum naphthae TaxID=2838853 RepID=UPI0030822966
MTTEKAPMSTFEEDAFALTQAAVALSQALEKNDQTALAAALDENLNLWTAIKTLVARDDCKLPADIRTSLTRLSDYTAKVTFDLSKDRLSEKVEALVNTNLQIAEGLLEGGAKKQ